MTAKPLPYGRHLIEADDLDAAGQALREGFAASGLVEEADFAEALQVLSGEQIVQGPRVKAFEDALAEAVGARFAVACSSGTAALHLALASLGVGEGDLCIVPAITFLSTATAARMCGAEVAFADVDAATGLMGPAELHAALERAGRSAKAVLPVHLGGRQCRTGALAEVAAAHGAVLVEDGCHALGAWSEGDGRVGECRSAAAAVFSFHPVKTIACGEGGMVTTHDEDLAARAARLRNHGVTREAALFVDGALSLDADGEPNPWSYEQLELGFNYRMTEVEAALGKSQLAKLGRFVGRRRELTALYDTLLAPLAPFVRPVRARDDEHAAPHLYAVHIDFAALRLPRAALMRALAARGIVTQVHYIPLYRQPYFAARYGAMRLPGAEAYYASTLSLPLFPAMTDEDAHRAAAALAAELMASRPA